MTKRIAVETLTLMEISDIFQKSIELAFPKAKEAIANQMEKLTIGKIDSHKWVETFEEFKGAHLNFYCQKLPGLSSPVVSIGMTHRRTQGLILMIVDTSNGGIPVDGNTRNSGWDKWVKIFTGHFCKRYAERIMLVEAPTFKIGSEGIMFSNIFGPVRITDTISEGTDEIEFQFKEGQAYGYRDSKSKIVYLKTVYSNDMLKGDRLNFREDWKETIDQLSELFKWNS